MPAVSSKVMIPWKRFWCHFGGPIHVGHGNEGFLSDPEDKFTKYYNPNLRPLHQLLHKPCLILCGDPGSGKSTVIREAAEELKQSLGANGNLISIEFRHIPTESIFTKRTFDSLLWQQWRNSTGKLLLIIDGIDEGLIKIPDFISYLSGQLRTEPIDRLNIILVCRSAEWPQSQGLELISLWEGDPKLPPIFELCPLRQIDVELAAENWGLNKSSFIKAVYQKQISGLARLPSTLLFLLDEFRESGNFSATHRELYEKGCWRLSGELDKAKIETLRSLRRTDRIYSQQEIHRAASRLAALLLLSGKAGICTGSIEEANSNHDLHLHEGADEEITEDLLNETIASGLFTSLGINRFGFAHQTFAECLAAQVLENLSLIQIRSLLCKRDSDQEHVIPQLAETAAWLAGARIDFFDHLCVVEPEALLRSDISQIQAQRKSALTTAVLEKVRKEELFDDLSITRFLESLNHKEISHLLHPYITNKSLHYVVRRLALEIAEECRLVELCDDVLRIVCDIDDDQHVRNRSAQTLRAILPDTRLSELLPLAMGKCAPDPGDIIKSCAMIRIVPSLWSISDALPFIRTFKSENSHWNLLKHHIPRHIREPDLPRLLGRLIRWPKCFDSLNSFQDIAEKTFVMALKTPHESRIFQIAVRVWVIKKQYYHPLPNSDESPTMILLKSDNDLRHQFVAAILNHPKTPIDFHVTSSHTPDLLQEIDLAWALNEISACPIPRRNIWANAIWQISRPESVSHCWDLFLARIDEIAELKSKFEWLRAWELDEPMARNAKADWLKRQRLEKKKSSLDHEQITEQILDDIANGKTFRWLSLCQILSLEEGQTHIYRPLKHDLLEFPGWKKANETRRQRINDAARKFLLKHSDGYDVIGDRTDYFEPGYIAVWFLRGEIISNPELKQKVATKWIHALLDPYSTASEDRQGMHKLAFELNPKATIDCLVKEIKEDNEKHGMITCLHSFREAWTAQFTSTVIELIKSENFKPGSIESILTFLAPNWAKDAAPLAQALLAPDAVSDPSLEKRSISVLTSCIGGMPAATWAFAWPIIEDHTVLAEKVFLRVANRFDHDRKQFLPTLSEKQLADLYLKLASLFPPEDDPSDNGESGGVSARKSMSWFRNDVINALESRSTDQACNELLRLANALPKEAIWLRWKHYNSRNSKRRKSWCPPLPQVVMELIQRREKRLVMDAQDLMEVVMESLNRFQEQLTHTSLPRSEGLWNWSGSDTRRSDFKPRDENFLSNEIARWLQDDLGTKGIIFGREVQPRRGQRTDIHVEAVSRNGAQLGYQKITLIIEVKGCWNAEILEAVDKQLVDDYLRKNGFTHGIYLVGWFVCEKWENAKNKLKSLTVKDAANEVANLALKYDGKTNPERVSTIVLDCRYP